MFSLLPRCQGEWRVAEVDRGGEFEVDAPPLGHFAAVVPGDGAAQVFGQLAHCVDHRGGHGVGGVVAGQVQQHQSGSAFDQSADRRLLLGPDDVGVGPGRGSGIAPGPFPRPALRTGRATLIASGAPRIAAAMRGPRSAAALVHGVGMLCARHRYRVIGTVVASNMMIPFSCGRLPGLPVRNRR